MSASKVAEAKPPMIEKIVRIENVGRFTKTTAAGQVGFAKLTIIYGDNGSGKTTLAGILRSLATGNSAFITERATLGGEGDPTVEILISGRLARYSARAWDRQLSTLEVFDSTFISENVYTGDRVEVEHRKNLYRVVVGAAAVRLATEVDELNAEGRRLASEIRRLEELLNKEIQRPFELKDFLAIETKQDVEERIREVTTQLNAARQAAKVAVRPQLESFKLPPSPRGLAAKLMVPAAALAENVVRRIREHIRDHLDESGEPWLRKGVRYSEGTDCPFCGQDLQGSSLFELYGEYFSEAYRERVIEIQQALNSLDHLYADRHLMELQRIATQNASRIRTWADLADLETASVSCDRMLETWRSVRTTLQGALQRKLADPASSSADSDLVEAQLRDFEDAVSELADFNGQLELANLQIARLKTDAASADQSKLEAELRGLRNHQIRQHPNIDALCTELSAARSDKASQTTAKAEARKKLEAEATSLLVDYEADINQLLRGFGANFSITGTKPVFPGGTASSVYKLQINGEAMALGDGKTPRGTPCFKTALSAGDKSTLALAFFLVRLRRDTELAEKVVIFDDPLSSLDSFRTSFTQQELARVAREAAQTVVLSHDPFFLKEVRSDSGVQSRSLRISRKRNTHSILEWDVDVECMPQAHKDYFVLRQFLNDGLPDGRDLLTVARSIRPYVEANLHIRYPEHFSGTQMLGEFIKAIRDAEEDDKELRTLRQRLSELEDINSFTRRFMHGQAPVTTEAEVESFIRKAIDFVHG